MGAPTLDQPEADLRGKLAACRGTELGIVEEIEIREQPGDGCLLGVVSAARTRAEEE